MRHSPKLIPVSVIERVLFSPSSSVKTTNQQNRLKGVGSLSRCCSGNESALQDQDHFSSFYAYSLKPRANGRNIVGQQFPTSLDDTCCVRLHTLLHVVGSCCAKFETDQTLSYVQTDETTPIIVGPTMLGVVASVYM